MMEDTPEKIINQNFERISLSSKKRKAHSYEFRMDQLNKLENVIEKYEQQINEAKKKDLGMGELGTFISTIFNTKSGNNNKISRM